MKLPLKIWQLSWPVIVSNVSIPLLGMVDIAVVGHDYPAKVLSAVAIGTMVFDVLFGLFIFLRMSTTGLVSQSPSKKVILQRALLCALLLSLIIIVSSPLSAFLITKFITMSGAIQSLFYQYFFIRIFSTPATLLNFVLMGYFFGRQNTKTPLLMLLIINLSGIGFDFILVKHLELGIKGLAFANLVAQLLGLVVGFIFLHKNVSPFTTLQESLFDLAALKEFFHINKDIFIRTVCLMVTIAFFTKLGASLGPKVVAANLILMSMHQFSSYFLDGFAISCEALVGEAIGKNNSLKLKKIIKACALYSVLVGAFLSLSYWFLGSWIISRLSSLPEVVAIANNNLIWLSLLPIASVASFLLDGVFIGATWTKPMRNTMISATFVVFFPLCFALKDFGNSGLWLSFIGFIIARGVFLASSLKRKFSVLMVR